MSSGRPNKTSSRASLYHHWNNCRITSASVYFITESYWSFYYPISHPYIFFFFLIIRLKQIIFLLCTIRLYGPWNMMLMLMISFITHDSRCRVIWTATELIISIDWRFWGRRWFVKDFNILFVFQNLPNLGYVWYSEKSLNILFLIMVFSF